MATYAQVYAKIKAALTQRQAGTKVAVAKHEEAEIAILDYVEEAKALFAEKYNSPYNGTANTILSKAIRYLALRELENRLYCYVAYVKAGVFAGGGYDYEIRIHKSETTFSDPQQDEVMFIWTSQGERSPLTGIHEIILEEYDGNGRYGNLIIDWSALTLGQEYTNQSYNEGSLFGYALISDMGVAGGGASFLKRESFTATQGQTVFTPTKFRLTEDALVMVNNAFQDPSTYTIVGNTLTFNAESNADDTVIIFN